MILYTVHAVLPITCIISGFSPAHPCPNGHVLLSRPTGSCSIRPAMLYQHTPSRDKLYTVLHVSFQVSRQHIHAPMDMSCYLVLLALALSDLLCCISTLPEGFKPKQQTFFKHYTFWMTYEIYAVYPQNLFSHISTTLILLVAVTRYRTNPHMLIVLQNDFPISKVNTVFSTLM